MEASGTSKHEIAGDVGMPEIWNEFNEFLRNLHPSRSPSVCSDDDVVEFLRLRRSSGVVSHIGHLSTAFEEKGGNPRENPFYSESVQTYLKNLLWISTSSEETQEISRFLEEIDAQSLGSKALCPVPDITGQWSSPATTPFTWTQELHSKFWEAVHKLSGSRRASPEQILWLMNGPGLTRDLVANHLQEYREGTSDPSQVEDAFTLLDFDFYFAGTLENPSSSVGASSVERKSGMHKHKSSIKPPRVPSHGIPVKDTVLVIYCGDNQDDDEISFVNYILQELRRLELVPLTYDLTRTETEIRGRLPSFRVGIVVFSWNYARSARCLDELARIMYYEKANGLLTIPVYFKVTPSDVRDQKCLFWEAFPQHGSSVPAERVQKWRDALHKTASLDGYKWIMSNQEILAKAIVQDARERLYSEIRKNLIEVDLQVERISSLLQRFEPSEVQILGLLGMAGIGKTTVARKTFGKLARSYDVSYFLPDFRLMCRIKGLNHLRDDFFSKILGDTEVSVNACDTKPDFLRDRVRGKTVLIVLDDVSNATDAEVLLGGFGWFCNGHKIIFTSRNKQVLVQCKAKELYEIRKLSESESFRLCSQYTTEQTWEATSLAMELVSYSSGIPLVLRVLGSSVQKHMNDARQHLHRLRKHPPPEIQDSFRRSFDGLDGNEKNVFLDLACFFRGENKDHIVQMLDGCGLFTDLGICGLVDESLISLVENRIEMPDAFQDMGRFIVCEENKEPGKRSRLWDANDIADVLTNDKGTGAIEGMFLDLSRLTCELSATVFERMYGLRLLKFYCSTYENQCELHLPQGLCSLPDELRLLHWESYPLKSLPRSFNPKNLVELNMPYSDMERLWKGTKNLEKLKKIRLNHSRRLTKIPRLSKATSLERIDLEGCTSLVKVGSSIRHLTKLVLLSLKDCPRLRSLPATVHLESLEVLDVSGCSELENVQDLSRNLKELYLARTAIREVPSSIGDLAKLALLDLEHCERLQRLPMGMRDLKSLVTLKLSGCSNLESLPNLDALCLRGSRDDGLTKTAVEKYAPSITHLPEVSGLDGFQGFHNSVSSQFRSKTPVMIVLDDILSTQGTLPTSISHSLASRLYALVSLIIGNACLLDVTEEIRWLHSLKSLDLSGNRFTKLPESIKDLSKLQRLRLRCCKSLGSLPELPQSLGILNAHGCVSLKTFHCSFEQFPRHLIFSNCFNLSAEVVTQFLAKVLHVEERMAPKRPQEIIKGHVAFSICVPASAAQKSSSYLRPGHRAIVHLTPSLRKTLLGFAVSVVVEFWDNYHNDGGFGIGGTCHWRTNRGVSHRLELISHCWPPKEATNVQKDHMFIFFCDVQMLEVAGEGSDPDSDALTAAKFQFYPVDGNNNVLSDSCTVKKSGVRAITAPSEGTRLSKKRPASSLDAEDMVPSSERPCLSSVFRSCRRPVRKRKGSQD